MANYNLAHLTQSDDQAVIGPIQDDEALFLFSLIRGMRLKRILEIGGLGGYSATNFLEALQESGTLYTIDLNPVPALGKNHKVLTKNAVDLTADEIDNQPLDLIFFDCHDYNVQMSLFVRLKDLQLVNDHTVLALHDTNLHPQKVVSWSYPVAGGFVHQPVERRMVNDLKRMGYDAFSLHTRLSTHDESLPYRHGVTICQKFVPMDV